MIKNTTQVLRAAIMLLLLGLWVQPALAAPLEQEETAPSYSFLEMGLNSIELIGPADRQTISFSLPAGQQVAEGATLTLNLRTLISDRVLTELTSAETEQLDGMIYVVFNGQVLDSLPLTAEAERSVTLEIPAAALAEPPTDGRYTLAVELQTGTNCTFGNAVSVTVGADSNFTLPTEAAPISADLRALPSPLYQRSFLPETAIMVVPDAPSEAELRSAMLVAAGLGRLTNNSLGLSLRRSGDITEAEYQANHLVMVGSPTDLPLLAEVKLPLAVEDGSFAAATLSADDGIIQAAVSPWNDAKLVLSVGGNSEAGLLKAAQSFVLNRLLLTNKQPDLSLIADVTTVAEETPLEEQSFADLGYTAPRRISAAGKSSLYYTFMLPTDQVATDEAFVEIAFAHAALLNYEQSSLTVVLNGNEIGGARLSDDTVDITRTRLLMPRNLLHPGRNELQLRANLAVRDGCIDDKDLDLWLNVWPDSSVNIPLEPATDSQLRSLSLDSYPTMLTSSPSLADTAFVVSGSDPASWEVAAGIIASLATQTYDVPTDLVVAFDGAVSDEIRQSHNLVLIGRPSQLTLVGELNEQLPAPFEPNSDVAIDRISRVAFRLSEQENVGYLQLLSAPWDDQRVVLAVLGNSPAGLVQAGQSLTRGELRSQLGGTFAVVVDQQVFIGGTRVAVSPLPLENSAISTTTTVSTTGEPVVANTTATVPDAGPPLLLAFVASVAIMLAVVGGIVGWGSYRRSRPSL